jgi:hypothetical protein
VESSHSQDREVDSLGIPVIQSIYSYDTAHSSVSLSSRRPRNDISIDALNSNMQSTRISTYGREELSNANVHHEGPTQTQSVVLDNDPFMQLSQEEFEELEHSFGITAVLQLLDMGFSIEQARVALRKCRGDLQRAVVFCLENAEALQSMVHADRAARASANRQIHRPIEQPSTVAMDGNNDDSNSPHAITNECSSSADISTDIIPCFDADVVTSSSVTASSPAIVNDIDNTTVGIEDLSGGIGSTTITAANSIDNISADTTMTSFEAASENTEEMTVSTQLDQLEENSRVDTIHTNVNVSNEGSDFEQAIPNESGDNELTDLATRLSARVCLDDQSSTQASAPTVVEERTINTSSAEHEQIPRSSPSNRFSWMQWRALPAIPLANRRRYLPYQVVQIDGKWRGTISLKQTQLQRGDQSPQGARPDNLVLGLCASREVCTDLCESVAPPLWSSKSASPRCNFCNVNFSMFNQGHHCRNCGHVVCSSCSDKIWPATMLPPTYHNNEKLVRVCHGCHFLMESFVYALKTADWDLAMVVYSSGNINLHNPLTIYQNYAYPVRLSI